MNTVDVHMTDEMILERLKVYQVMNCIARPENFDICKVRRIDDRILIDVDGDLNYSKIGMSKYSSLPFKIGDVTGDLDMQHSVFDSLDNMPDTVRGVVDLDYMKNLTSLKGVPKLCAGSYFSVQHTALSSVEHFPVVHGSAYLHNNSKLKNLRNIHKTGKIINGEIVLDTGNIESNVLGLLLTGCHRIANVGGRIPTWQSILNEFLIQLRGTIDKNAVIECQNALIDAGLEEYAAL